MGSDPPLVVGVVNSIAAPAPMQKLGAQTLYVLVANLFTLIVGLPLQIYVSRILGAGGLGVFSLLDAGFATIIGLLAIGLPQTIVRFVPEYLERRDYSNIRLIIVFGTLVSLGIGIIAYCITLLLLEPIGRWWPQIAEHKDAIMVMGLIVPLSMVLYVQQQALRGFQEIRYMLFGSSFVSLTVKAALTVASFSIGQRLLGYISATVIAMACATLWMGYGLWREIAALPRSLPKTDASAFPEWRRYATICYVAGLLSTATSSVDRFLLGTFIGASSVGVLMVVRQLQQLPVLFNQMFLMVGTPMLSAAHSRNDIVERQHLYVLMTDWIVRTSLPLILFLLLFGRPLLLLYGLEFSENGIEPLRILVAVQFFNLAVGPGGALTMMCGLEGVALRLDIYSALLTAILMVTLIPQFGLLGAAFSSAAGIIFINTTILALIRRRLGMRWWNKRFLGWFLPVCGALAVGASVLAAGRASNPVILGATLAGMYAAFFGVNAMQGLHKDDLEMLRYIRDRLLNRAVAD